MIRLATNNDIPGMVYMARALWAEGKEADRGLSFDEISFTLTLRQAMDNRMGAVVMVSDDGEQLNGMASLFFVPWYADYQVLVAYVGWWWVDPKDRRGHVSHDLLDALEELSKARGAKTLKMAAVPNGREKAMARYYQQRGFRPSEAMFYRKL